MKLVLSLTFGFVFGVGLALSGMTDTLKVQAFLDIAGQWDASLLFVLSGALVTALFGFPWILKRKRPLVDSHFYLPTRIRIDLPLVSGAILFGIGWSLVGYCPGPAIASLGYFHNESLIFVTALFFGSYLASASSKILSSSTTELHKKPLTQQS